MPAKMQQKWQNRQCYFCPEPYSKEHKCGAKGALLLELEDGEEGTLGDAIPNPKISLNALIGLSSIGD